MNLNDESYYEEVIQHLIGFVCAGEDTTGVLIEVCLYELAEHPEYQDQILEDLDSNSNLHASKALIDLIDETNRLIGPIRMSLSR